MNSATARGRAGGGLLARAPAAAAHKIPASGTAVPKEGRMEIQPEEGGLEAIISKLKTKP